MTIQMFSQQWDPVILRKKLASPPVKPQVHPEAIRAKKVEEDDLPVTQRSCKAFGRKVADLRIKHKKTQDELAKAIQERPDVIKNLEKGVIANGTQQVITKINKALGLFGTADILKIPPNTAC